MTTQAADRLLHQQVQSVIRRWREGSPADARGAMAEIPDIAGYPSLMIDLAYEQYCLQEEAGGPPAVSMFCAGFGAIASQLRDVLEGHKVLLNNPQLLQVAAWPTPGDQWDHIQFVRELGRGAFARAFLVEDASINRRVVLKLAHRESAEGLSLGTLKHPHVVDILWSRAMNGFHVVAMPYEAATTLLFVIDNLRPRLAGPLRADALLAVTNRGEIPPTGPPLLTGSEPYATGVAAIFERLADALDHAQRHGISHGDLKPANVLIGPTGNPYLIDFNLASDANRSRAVLGGTLPYMAPERLRSMQEGATQIAATESSDVYSFGVVLFEALTGRLPFGPPAECDAPQKAVATELAARQAATLTRPPLVPRPLFALVRSCLVETAADRPAFRDLAWQLHRYRTRGRRAKRLAAAVGAIGLTTALALGYARYRGHEAGPGEKTVVAELEQPRTKQEFMKRGHHWLRAGKWPAAAKDFAAAFEIEPDGKTAATFAFSLKLVSQSGDALVWAQEAVEKFGYREPWALNNFAVALKEKTGILPNIIPIIALSSEALQRQPDLWEARYMLALGEYWRDFDTQKKKLRDTRCLREISRVLARGSRSRMLCQDAAMIYASAGPLFQLRALELAEEAAGRGQTTSPVVRHPHLESLLKDAPGYLTLQFTPTEHVATKKSQQLWVPPPEE